MNSRFARIGGAKGIFGVAACVLALVAIWGHIISQLAGSGGTPGEDPLTVMPEGIMEEVSETSMVRSALFLPAEMPDSFSQIDPFWGTLTNSVPQPTHETGCELFREYTFLGTLHREGKRAALIVDAEGLSQLVSLGDSLITGRIVAVTESGIEIMTKDVLCWIERSS